MSAWQVCDLPLSYTQKLEVWVPSNPPFLCADFQAHGAPNPDHSQEDGHEMGTARFLTCLSILSMDPASTLGNRTGSWRLLDNKGRWMAGLAPLFLIDTRSISALPSRPVDLAV